jgi:hypothetical protein
MSEADPEPSSEPIEPKPEGLGRPRRPVSLVDVSDPIAFPTAEKLSELLRASQAGHRVQSIERAASAAGELETMLRQSMKAYHQQVIFPLEEQPDEESATPYLHHRFTTIEEPATLHVPSAIEALPQGLSTQPVGPADGAHILQRGIQVSLGVMFASVFVMLASNAVGLAGLFFGLSVFCFANYASYRVGERDVIISPRVSLMGIYGGIGLAATMVVASVT